jgi:hypothetical protein
MDQTHFVGITLMVVSLGSDVIVLFLLSQRKLPPNARAVWALVILLFPALGALAFLIGASHDKHLKRL